MALSHWRAGLVMLGLMAVIGVAGCGRMGAALGQQWIVVDLRPGTPVATALHVRAACSHIQNVSPMALPAQRSVGTMMYGVRYNTTHASPANIAELQTCLQKFPSVQGVSPQNVGDEGS